MDNIKYYVAAFFALLSSLYLMLSHFKAKRSARILSEVSTDPLYHSHASSLSEYTPGSLNKSKVLSLASSLKKSCYINGDLQWFAENANFSKFVARDGLVLQSYALRQRSTTGIVIVFSCGWTETIMKYAHILRRFHQKGAEIFAFDMRGQGFSQSTGWASGLGGRVTHVESFNEYSKDLIDFVVKVVRVDVGPSRSLMYIGNSLGGLIGYIAQNSYVADDADNATHKKSGMNTDSRQLLFDKLVLICPCIQPRATEKPMCYGLEVLYWLTPRLLCDVPLIRLDRTSHPEFMTHDMEVLAWWEDFKLKASRQLLVAAPSMRWLNEVHRAGVSTYTQKNSYIIDHTDILVVTAGNDLMVCDEKILRFYKFIEVQPERRQETMRRHVVLKGARHELWIESSDYIENLLHEISDFVDGRNREVKEQ